MPEDHKQQAEDQADGRKVHCAVLTVSDTRTEETDDGGRKVIEILQAFDHTVSDRKIVRDDPPEIKKQLEKWLASNEIDAIITTGGTGISRRDTTIEVVKKLLTTELEGFGELFRSISCDEIGSSAMLSRAVGGLVARENPQGSDTFIFSIPGSVNAVETAMQNLIGPELNHLVWERKK